ncbi:MAG TPA: glycosyltransferase, partial [Woeseiaceae bacterium]|nr:glycosyltransferase [Woeseiaceae bacterium]
LIQYMACGLPVVASPVGINTEIVVPAQNGILARAEADWYQALRELAARPGGRARMGEAGRTLVEERYSTRVTAPLLLDALELAGRQGT